MSSHTKGLWKLRCEGSVCVVDENGNAIAFTDTFLPAEQCIANARLISVAPELAEALNECVSGGYLDRMPEQKRRMENILAKAEAL